MNMLVQLSPIILMIVIFYFLLIRPQQKRQRQVQEMQAALQKGDQIVTIGGLHGVIDAIDEDTIIISSNNSKLTFDRGAIREVKSEV
ncbi:MAG TPA: preprotein translocase subunit YajC [Pseudogracilibacillus sp.]|nr:preprotein translocase subunit YajC [Pseudogracilibacillus sp.]